MTHSLPEFTPRLAKISRDYYHIGFLEDGYPGKVINGQIVPHPIYGIYVLNDYLFQYQKNRHPRLQQAIIVVADAVISRMQPYLNTLVFWYDAESPFNSSGRKYYSGLTQGYYAKVLAKVYELTGLARFKQAAEKVFQSLTVPVDKGGVSHDSVKGPSLQEYPMGPNGYVLNGWLSIILSLREYAHILKDGQAEALWRANAKTVSELLPLYDVPAYCNSRYTLNGHRRLRLTVSTPQVHIQKVSIHVPSEGTYPFVIKEKSNKWENHLVAESVEAKAGNICLKNQEAVLNVLFSRFSFPRENILLLDLHAPAETTLQVDISGGVFDPKRASLLQRNWIRIDQRSLRRGANNIRLKIPWTHLELVGHPTTFKKIGGRYYNVYHFIHIERLKTLYAWTGQQRFLDYVRKWEAYVKSWPDIAVYQGLETQPYR